MRGGVVSAPVAAVFFPGKTNSANIPSSAQGNTHVLGRNSELTFLYSSEGANTEQCARSFESHRVVIVPPPPYARKFALPAVRSRMQLGLRATRRTPHAASRLLLAISTWPVKTRRAPSRHCRDVWVLCSYDCGHACDSEYTPPLPVVLETRLRNSPQMVFCLARYQVYG